MTSMGSGVTRSHPFEIEDLSPNANHDRPRVDNTPADSGRMWPLDVSAVALGGLLLFLIVTQFRFDDPRPLYNAKTYLVAVPCISLALAFILRLMASRFLQKSIQLGFLFSVSIHLLLLIFAIHYVVFSSFQPLVSKGEKRERTPIRKAIPEHIFQAPKESKETPDWSKPVEAETKSRVIPEEQRQLPPVERSQPRLEVPKPRQPEMQPMQKSLMEKKEPSAAEPMPADAPGKLARRPSNQIAPIAQTKPIEVPSPNEQAASASNALPAERRLAEEQRSASSRQAPSRLEMAEMASSLPSLERTSATPVAASRSPTQSMPKIGDAGLTRARRSQSIARPAAVVGAAPAPVSVSIARTGSDASIMLTPTEVPINRSGETTGAQISVGQSPSFMAEANQPIPNAGTVVARNSMSAAAGAPTVDAGPATSAPGRSRRINIARGAAPIGIGLSPTIGCAYTW